MATFYRCDRCNCEVKDVKNILKVNLPHVSKYRQYHQDLEDLKKSLDLCEPCLVDLYDWTLRQNRYKKEEPDKAGFIGPLEEVMSNQT